MTPAEKLISSLQGVKECGPGRWVALCPSHDDQRPSLSIRETEAGICLIHCFSGCPAASVVAGAGLALADLFPSGNGGPPLPRRDRVSAADALRCLRHEGFVLLAIANDLMEGARPGKATAARIALAAGRIERALEAVG